MAYRMSGSRLKLQPRTCEYIPCPYVFRDGHRCPSGSKRAEGVRDHLLIAHLADCDVTNVTLYRVMDADLESVRVKWGRTAARKGKDPTVFPLPLYERPSAPVSFRAPSVPVQPPVPVTSSSFRAATSSLVQMPSPASSSPSSAFSLRAPERVVRLMSPATFMATPSTSYAAAVGSSVPTSVPLSVTVPRASTSTPAPVPVATATAVAATRPPAPTVRFPAVDIRLERSRPLWGGPIGQMDDAALEHL